MRVVRGPLGIGALALLLLAPGRDTARPLSLHGSERQAKTSVALLASENGVRLAAIDDRSLRPLGKARTRLGFVDTWAFDRSNPALLAVAARNHGDDDDAVLRFVNVRSLRLVKRTVDLGGWTRALLWARPDRVVALVSRCCLPGTSVLAIDPGARRVVARQEIEDDVSALARAGDSLVLLVTPHQKIGPARLVVAAADGSVRSVPLTRVTAGTSFPSGTEETSDPIAETRLPGLAADASGAHAYILQPDGPAAEVDLRTLAVTYHDLTGPSSLLARFAAWLTPAAEAKGANGPRRTAIWLGDGLLALTGTDERAVKRDNGIDLSGTPAGLAIVDTRDWSIRALDAGADTVTPAEGLLLATGSRWTANGSEPTGMGLAAYGADRSLRFRLLAGRSVWLDAALAGHAYVSIATQGSNSPPVEVVDLASGKIVGERKPPVPTPLLGDAPVQ
jgi:hypothetical protein